MGRIVAELSPESYPNKMTMIGRCTECTDPSWAPKQVTRETRRDTIAYLKGWFQPHVLDTGHRVVIEEEE